MKTIEIKLPHITLAAMSYGEEHKPVIIALHGWLDNAASFQPLAPYLSDYHVIAIDWAGHGHSQHRSVDASYQFSDYVYDLYCIIEQLNLNHVDIVAHSLGAIVASVFAGTFPDKVNKLILIEALGPLVASADKTRENLFKSITNQYRNLDKNKARHLDMQSAIHARKLASDFDHDIAGILVRRGLKKVSDGYTWRSDIRLRNLSRLRMTQAQANDILSGIKASTLLVLGDSGMPALREHLPERKELLQDLTVISIAGGHHVHMQQPALLAQHIIEHIKR